MAQTFPCYKQLPIEIIRHILAYAASITETIACIPSETIACKNNTIIEFLSPVHARLNILEAMACFDAVKAQYREYIIKIACIMWPSSHVAPQTFSSLPCNGSWKIITSGHVATKILNHDDFPNRSNLVLVIKCVDYMLLKNILQVIHNHPWCASRIHIYSFQFSNHNESMNKEALILLHHYTSTCKHHVGTLVFDNFNKQQYNHLIQLLACENYASLNVHALQVMNTHGSAVSWNPHYMQFNAIYDQDLFLLVMIALKNNTSIKIVKLSSTIAPHRICLRNIKPSYEQILLLSRLKYWKMNNALVESELRNCLIKCNMNKYREYDVFDYRDRSFREFVANSESIQALQQTISLVYLESCTRIHTIKEWKQFVTLPCLQCAHVFIIPCDGHCIGDYIQEMSRTVKRKYTLVYQNEKKETIFNWKSVDDFITLLNGTRSCRIQVVFY
jgi:hypothetical protein